ncbi:dihydrolipoamide acetyltransferase family protein [Arthrobacter castelli]|uniref:dihydrolipoamide acetyltransferase family protein n=1 Tax=Arthrobacter castelli TaxID=271431 RepID=UPI0003FD37F9|nr:dihydrolipoamide acetyltransferase family protein [Arthrobacter castelli]
MSATQQRQVFLLPDLGEGLTEAELVNWLVAVGDEVAVDQAVAEVETAKSVVEVPSPFAGTVAVLHGDAGATIDVGKPLISIDDAGPGNSAAGEAYRTEERAGTQAPAGTEPAESGDSGSGNVLIGYGTPAGAGGSKRTRRPKKASPPTSGRPISTPAGQEAAAGTQAPLVISPLVRRMVKDAGLKPADIAGSGSGGMITRKDVEARAASASKPSAQAQPAAVQTATGRQEESDKRSGLGIASRIPMTGVRKTVAANMSKSRTEIPEATVWVDVDATELLQMRSQLKAAQPEDTPGLLAFIARFVLAGLAKYPQLNTRVVDGGDGTEEIIGFDGVNLGFAAQTDRGLMVPSVRRAEAMSARGLDAEIRRLTAVARDGKATPEELTSGTFTLNNYGVFGVDGSAAIINYPEAAILGVGRIIDKPWVVNGDLAVRKVTELTLTFDHRVCDGGTAGGFLRYVADAMEKPGFVLADL